MQLIEALAAVADLYPEERGWVARCAEGRIEMSIGHLGPSYSASDHMLLCASRRLEVVIEDFLARHPAATRDEHWKVSPRESEE
jgi:hypothetical protein